MTTAEKAKAGEPVNEKLYPSGLWKDRFLLSHAGSLLGALELSGADPNGLSSDDLQAHSIVLRNILQTQHPDTAVTQYYWHYEGVKVDLQERQNPRSDLLSSRRQAFLNEERTLSNSRLFWMLDVPTSANLNKVFSASAMKMLFTAPFDRKARDSLVAKFSNWGAWLVEQEELRRQYDLLNSSLKDLDSKLQYLSETNEQQSPAQLWALCRAVCNMRPEYLESALTEAVPVEDWDRFIMDGDVHPVMIDGLDCLKIEGPDPVYIRIASVVGYGSKEVPSGMWARGSAMPVMSKGNYLIVTRAKPMSVIEKSMMITGKENELHRSQMKLSSLLKGDDTNSEIEKKVQQSKALRGKLEELEEAADSEDRYYTFHSHVVLFERDPSKLRAASQDMNTALTQSKFAVVWESAGLIDLFPMLLPAYPKRCFRSAEFTASQVGACSLAYRSHQGIKSWGDKTKEEALYVLENLDGTPFYYTPFIGDKCLVLGVGPTRSGKTYWKNVVAGHFLKYGVPYQPATEHDPAIEAQGSFYHSIDVDPGTEPLSMFFQDEGGIFRMQNPATDRGFNSFVMADGTTDSDFIHHMLTQIRIMLKLNDSADLRELSATDQQELDRGLIATLGMTNSKLQNLSGLYNHLSQDLQAKLARWVQGGLYGNLMDNEVDGVGHLNKRVAAYNLSGVKDKQEMAQLAINEIFYRVTKLFENPANLRVPKMLEIDEAQYFFSIPGSAERAITKARTWFKHNGGMGFWTQSPEHYAALDEWTTLRSAASTWIFMADQNMDRAAYQRAFPLTDGECDAIANLKARQQAYIIQREVGISKTVNLFTAKEEHVIATSRPSESVIVREMLNMHSDIDVAVAEMIKRIFPANRS